tara:strand:- start:5007 stop:5186 length:180 start_codon:yes stop_codon:yes gene_type:complete
MIDSEERVKNLKARLAELYVRLGYSPTGGPIKEPPRPEVKHIKSSADILREKLLGIASD